MNITAIVQARMGSTRLPGKVLMEIEGKSLLGYLLERLEMCEELDRVIVAAPMGDHEIRSWLKKYCGFGHELPRVDDNDVAGRLMACLLTGEIDAICRICADSPLLDPNLVDDACEIYRAMEPDIVINARAGFPAGQNVEVFDRKLLEAYYPHMDDEEKEHVTIGWRRNLQDHAAVVFRAGWLKDPPSFAVDTQEDFDRMTALIGRMDKPHTEYGWEDLVEL